MNGSRDWCTLCGQQGHLPVECKSGRWPRYMGFAALLLAASAIAQDAPDQKLIDKCAAEGGCALISSKDFKTAMNAAVAAGYGLGVQSCVKHL